LFFLVRYFGICWVIISAIFGSSFVPGPANVCSALMVLSRWAQWLFISAADLVMILRVWALYNRSKFILSILLIPYAIEVLALLATAFAYSIWYNSYGVVTPVLTYALCGSQNVSVLYAEIVDFAQLALSALMCLFISIRFIGEWIQSYRARKRFQLSNYLTLLMRESIFYFFVVMTFALINSLLVFGLLTSVWWGMVEFIPVSTLVPRFTISLRKLYVRDVQQGRESTLDTAFGIGYDEVVASTIMFADTLPGQNEAPRRGEEMAMQERNVFGIAA